MYLTKREVVERLCALCTEVRDKKFCSPSYVASDCFCQLKPEEANAEHYRMDACVIEYIENCVKAQLHSTKPLETENREEGLENKDEFKGTPYVFCPVCEDFKALEERVAAFLLKEEQQKKTKEGGDVAINKQ